MTAPDKITLARRIGSRQHTTLEPGETMSHGYTDAQTYHHQRTVDELLEALEEAQDEIDRYIWQEYPGDHPVHERYRERDFAANPARIAIAKHRKGG